MPCLERLMIPYWNYRQADSGANRTTDFNNYQAIIEYDSNSGTADLLNWIGLKVIIKSQCLNTEIPGGYGCTGN